jgi:DNA polymerase delta subunit 1
MSFEDERELLKRWQSLLLESDPDVIIGYNICNFDLPYVYERIQALGLAAEGHQWGRIRHRWVFFAAAYGAGGVCWGGAGHLVAGT